MYHIYTDGYRVTAEALTLDVIVSIYGSVKMLEKAGYRLIKVS